MPTLALPGQEKLGEAAFAIQDLAKAQLLILVLDCFCFSQTLFSQSVGSLVRGNVFLGRAFENVSNGVVNAGHLTDDSGMVVSIEFSGNIDQTTGIDGVIRCVNNASFEEVHTISVDFQLIVGRTGNYLALELWYGALVENGTESAGGKDLLNTSVL